LAGRAGLVKRWSGAPRLFAMAQNPKPPSRDAKPAGREERLAAKLRENLRRRKVQASQIRETNAESPGGESADPESHAGLSKEHRKS